MVMCAGTLSYVFMLYGWCCVARFDIHGLDSGSPQDVEGIKEASSTCESVQMYCTVVSSITDIV